VSTTGPPTTTGSSSKGVAVNQAEKAALNKADRDARKAHNAEKLKEKLQEHP
jgi:hypothetical protein